MISLEAYLMGRDKEFPPTAEMLAGANTLLNRVEELFYDLGIELTDDDLSSGYRPGYYNTIAGGSINSTHRLCLGIDLDDDDRNKQKAILGAPQLLDKHGLYMEDPYYTVEVNGKTEKKERWVHLQTRKTRNRVFKP